MSIEDHIKRDVKLMNKQGRGLEREITRMNREKRGVEIKLKKYAREGDLDMVNSLSKQFLVYKSNIRKTTKMKGDMANVKQKIQLMKSVNDINHAIMSLTDTMKEMNSRMGVENINKMIMEYDIENSRTESTVEMFDDVLDNDIDVDEQNEIVARVLDEIGVEVSGLFKGVPNQNNEVEDELGARYERLVI